MEAEIRIPTTQYGYISIFIKDYKDLDDVLDYHNLAVKKYQDSLKEPISIKGLELRDLQKLLYKRLCNQGLEIEEVDKLGTDKLYSQKDIHKIVESLLAKSKREAGGDRADDIHRD